MKASLTTILILLAFSTSVVADKVRATATQEPESQVYAKEEATSTKVESQECLQCGAWQIIGGPDLGGGSLVINEKTIIIPFYGVFDYSIKQLEVSSGNPVLVMLLQQQKEDPFCPGRLLKGTDGGALTLEMELSGHFKENSIATFNLREGQSGESSLSLYCWNIEREDPCASGSAIGTSVCLACTKLCLTKSPLLIAF